MQVYVIFEPELMDQNWILREMLDICDFECIDSINGLRKASRDFKA